MTVEELIKELQNLNPLLPIMSPQPFGDWSHSLNIQVDVTDGFKCVLIEGTP